MHDWQSEVRARLAPLRLRPEREADIVDEIAQHLAERYREALQTGASPDEAARLALAEFHTGNALAQRIAALKQAHARANITVGASQGRLLADLWHDLRYAARAFAKQRTFAATAVLILALGIGATTAIFSVVYSVLIKPLPYPNADEIVRLRHSVEGRVGSTDFEPTMYVTYRDENRTLAGIGLWQDASMTLTDGTEPERLRAIRVADGTLQLLGVQPVRGRWFIAEEHGPAAEGVAPVILSYGFWQRRFGGDDAIGREISLDSRPARVVGIMPADFRFLDLATQPDVIAPVQIDPANLVISGGWSYQALARLKSGVTPAEARADLERMLPIWLDSWPLAAVPGLTREALAEFPMAPVVRPLKDDIVGDAGSMLWVLMGAIGAVLLVACANIANLTLVRAEARRQEFAVRAALGAGAARIARTLLVENLVLGTAGSVLGLLLAYVGLQFLVAIGPSNLPRLREIGVYPPVLAFTVAVSLLSTLLFGSITVLKHAVSAAAPLVTTARGATASRERNRVRSALVVVQVALALALVVSAALMIRTFQELRDVDPGFAGPTTVQTGRIWMPSSLVGQPEQYTRMQHEILDRVAALPGVAAVGFASALPMEGPGFLSSTPIVIEGQASAPEIFPPSRSAKFVSPGYFETLGTRIIAGREITWSDIEGGGRVVVISESFAREIAGEPAAALGKRIRTFVETDAWREVVGVAQGVHETGLYEDAPSLVYFPALVADMWGTPMIGTPAAAIAIRSDRAGTASLMDEVRQAVLSVNPSLPVTHTRTMSDLYSASLARTSFVLVMLAIAGAMALVLGIVGIYGVIAYVVAQRTREIGIRSALGAEPKQLARMFLLQGLALSALGAVGGLAAAIVLGRLMSSLLFGVGPLDPLAYATALAVTIAAAAVATYLPARRAAKIDPMTTLRAD
jgi:putative ABC transport system permease protein